MAFESIDLQRLSEYQVFMESKLRQEVEDLEKSIVGKDLNFGEELDFAGMHYQVSIGYPHLFRSTFLIQCFSVFEDHLIKICGEVGLQTKQRLSVNDLGSSGINNVKVYLSRILHVKLENTRNWTEMSNFQKVRNNIIHKRCIVEHDTHLFNYLKQQPSIRLLPLGDPNYPYMIYDPNYKLRSHFEIVNPDFNMQFLVSMELFLDSLQEQIYEAFEKLLGDKGLLGYYRP